MTVESASPASIGAYLRYIWTPMAGDDDIEYIFLGKNTLTAVDPHHLLITESVTGTPVGKAGSSPGVSPYTDSIPYNAGGPAPGALVVEQPNV